MSEQPPFSLANFDALVTQAREKLIDQISCAILEGTTEIEMIDNDPCNVFPAVWRQSERSTEANDLARALTILLDFLETPHAIGGLIETRRALEKMNIEP